MLLQLGFEQFEQSERIGRRAREAGQHLAIAAESAHLAGIALHDRVAQRHLAIAGDGDAAVAPHGQDGGGMKDVGILAGVHGGLRGVPTEVGTPLLGSSMTFGRTP